MKKVLSFPFNGWKTDQETWPTQPMTDRAKIASELIILMFLCVYIWTCVIFTALHYTKLSQPTANMSQML